MDADLRPRRADESLGELAREASAHASTLIRDEVALAKSELREDIREAVAGITLFSAAGVMALLGAVALTLTLGFGIGRLFGEGWTWLGFLIVTVVHLLIAGVIAMLGKRKAAQIPPPAPRTTRQLQKTAAATREIRP